MMPSDARPEADEIGHDSSTCTACTERHRVADAISELQADYQSLLDEEGKALLRQAVQARRAP